MTARKVVKQEEMCMQMLDPRSYNKIAENRQDLICIQHPFLFLESIHIIKLLNFLSNTFGTCHNRLQLINRRPWPGHLIKMIHTRFIRLRMIDNNISNLNILNNRLRITLFQSINIFLDRQPIKTKLIFNCESLWTTTLQIR